MKSWLFVGAKVVCVGLARGDYLPIERYEGSTNLFKRDTVYTVRDIVMQRDHPFIRVEEVVLPGGYLEPVADARGFKPVSTINTDATVAALNQMMVDHVNHASGGLGIGKVRA